MRYREVIGLLLICFFCGSCSALIYDYSGNQVKAIRKGLTQQNVVDLMGEPTYRRFNDSGEEWEYRGYISNAGWSIVRVNFVDHRVVGLDSFRDDKKIAVLAATPPPTINVDCSTSWNTGSHLTDKDRFENFYEEVKMRGFDSDRTKLIGKRIAEHSMSSAQCARLAKTYSFDDARMKMLEMVYPCIKDKSNFSIAIDQLDFLTNKSTVERFVRDYDNEHRN